jgi:hypothetical protein
MMMSFEPLLCDVKIYRVVISLYLYFLTGKPISLTLKIGLAESNPIPRDHVSEVTSTATAH